MVRVFKPFTVFNPQSPPSPTPSPSPPPSSPPPSGTPPPPVGTGKVWLALVLTYVSLAPQRDIYKPRMNSSDMTRLRVSGSSWNETYAQEIMTWPGLHGLSIVGLDTLRSLAPAAKQRGFDFLEYNAESGFDADADTVIAQTAEAYQIAKQNGMFFRVTPETSFIRTMAADFAPHCDFIHIQSQPWLDDIADAVNKTRTAVRQLRAVKPSLVITAQVEVTPPGGFTVSVANIKSFIDQVMRESSPGANDNVVGISQWFGGDELDELDQVVQYFTSTYP